MRVSKERAAENRVAILDAASRLFRRRGVDGVGVAEIAKEAGLTHGAIYAHFPSKDALVAAAFVHGVEGSLARARAGFGERRPTFEDHLDGLLGEHMRDQWETGCPLAASASEAGRQGADFSACYARAFEEMFGMIEGSMQDSIPVSRRRSLAMTAVAAQIGAIAVSRALQSSNAALADEVLRSVRATLSAAYEALPQSGSRRRRSADR